MSSKAHRHHIFETKKQADKTLLMKEILTKFRDVLRHQDTRVSAIWTGQKRHRKKAGKSRVLLFATMWAKWHFSLNCLSCKSPWFISLWFEFFKKKFYPLVCSKDEARSYTGWSPFTRVWNHKHLGISTQSRSIAQEQRNAVHPLIF